MIYVFLATGFEEIEALTAIDWLRRAEKKVVVVGIGEEVIVGAHGISVVADTTDLDLPIFDGLEMVVLPGGMPGTLNLEKSLMVKKAVDYCVSNDIYVAAICAAPSILGHRNLLEGKKATCYPGYESQLFGAELSDEKVVVDGKIITGRSAGVASEFALKLVEVLCGEKRAKALEAALVLG